MFICYIWQCWETAVGSEIYRLVLVDFFFILGATFFLEFLRRYFHSYSDENFHKRLRKYETPINYACTCTCFLKKITLVELLCYRIFGQYCCKKKQDDQEVQSAGPEFDIGRNTLDLIYSQALCWSVVYTPLTLLLFTSRHNYSMLKVMDMCLPPFICITFIECLNFRLGTFYSPLLSLVMMVKLFIIFYVKMVCNTLTGSSAWLNMYSGKMCLFLK